MAKIIKITGDTVLIGRDDGSILECSRSDLTFEPVVGKAVEIFTDNYKEIVTEKQLSPTGTEGINITIDNTNNNKVESQMVYQQGKVVNKVAYLLITFFLGAIGIHKFYAGKVGTGILFLLFCWTGIPAFIAFIDFIVACFKKADSQGNIIV